MSTLAEHHALNVKIKIPRGDHHALIGFPFPDVPGPTTDLRSHPLLRYLLQKGSSATQPAFLPAVNDSEPMSISEITQRLFEIVQRFKDELRYEESECLADMEKIIRMGYKKSPRFINPIILYTLFSELREIGSIDEIGQAKIVTYLEGLKA